MRLSASNTKERKTQTYDKHNGNTDLNLSALFTKIPLVE